MSAEEMREYCKSLASFNVKVQVRLKSGHDVMTGRIDAVNTEGFNLTTEDKLKHTLRFAWVARIKNA